MVAGILTRMRISYLMAMVESLPLGCWIELDSDDGLIANIELLALA
jgi:hypothetical protein